MLKSEPKKIKKNFKKHLTNGKKYDIIITEIRGTPPKEKRIKK